MDTPIKPTLIIDSDIEFFLHTKSEATTGEFPPEFAHTHEEAMEKLRRSPHGYQSVLLNPESTRDFGLSLLKIHHETQPTTPFFYLTHTQASLPFSNRQLKNLGITGIIQKPQTYSDIVIQLYPFMQDSRFQELKPLLQSKKIIATSLRDNLFTPVPVTSFLGERTSPVDLYIRITPHKILKFIHEGESISTDRLKALIKKEIRFLEIKTNDQRRLLQNCHHTDLNLKALQYDTRQVKNSKTLEFADHTIRLLRNIGLKEDSIKTAIQMTYKIEKIIDNLYLEPFPEIETFLQKIPHLEHGLGTLVISSLLLKGMHMQGEKIQTFAGLTALFHDLGEDIFPKGHPEHSKHPLMGAQMLKSISKIDAAVIQAVEQHHEKRDSTGYPKQLGTGQISFLAELIGLSDEFLGILEKAYLNPHLNPIQVMDERINNQYSHPLILGFKKVFMGATSSDIKRAC